jgi:hypothetical protein
MNNKLNARERKHLGMIKSLPCVVCDSPPPSDAHHIEQHKQYLCLPLCKDCHQGSLNGIHGQKNMWRVMKMTELDALNKVLGQIL